MSNQIIISSGAKVRSLEGVLTGTSGIVDALGINVPSGIPQLDSNGKILVDQLPNSVMEFKGTWNVSTNTPYLVNGVGNAGDVYLVEGAATGGTSHDFGAGAITFYNGDQVVYSGSTWERASGSSGTVTSVAITESGDALNITGSPITNSGTINIGFNGNSTQYINGEGNLVTFPTLITEAQNLITDVYNETGATLTKGTVVYINGGHGNLPTVTKAIATGDATSAQTFGVVQADISNNNNGHVVVIGSLGDLDTQAYAAGTQLYLSSTTAGAWTSVKQYAPAHLVYVGIVVRSHPTQGIVEVKIQNGFELDELHNVSAQSPSNNDGLFYNSSNSLWENKSIATALGYTPADASLVVPYTGATTNVDLGSNFLKARTFYSEGSGGGGSYAIKNGTTPSFEDGYTILSSNDYRLNIVSTVSATTKAVYFGFSGVTATRTYTLPDLSGTLALLEGTQTFTGAKTFNTVTNFNQTVFAPFLSINSSSGILLDTDGSGNGGALKFTQNTSTSVGSPTQSSLSTSGNSKFYFYAGVSSGVYRGFYLDNSLLTTNAVRTYQVPDASGTIALTSDIPTSSTYVDLTSAQTITGIKTFSNEQLFGNGITLTGGYITYTSGSYNLTLNTNILTANRNVYIKDGSGTLAFTSDIPSLSGYVQGSGTTNYHAKFTASSTIGNSMLTDDGTTLQSIGATRSNLYLKAASNSYYSQLAFTNGTNGSFGGISYNNSGQYMQFETNSSEWARLNSNGNFLIGTTSDNGSKLQVSGAATFSSSVTATNYFSTAATTSYAYSYYANTGAAMYMGIERSTGQGLFTGSSAYATVFGSTNATSLQFGTNGIIRATITSSGNVGIGTSSPGFPLEVYKDTTGYATINVRNPNTTVNSGASIRLYSSGYDNMPAEIINKPDSTGGTLVFNIRKADGSYNDFVIFRGDGNVRLNSTTYSNTTSGSTRSVYIGNGDYFLGGISSVRASKKNIENISNVDWVYQLNPVTFNYRKKDEEGNYTEETYEDLNYGLIAEDTAPIADFLINYNDKEDGTKEMVGIEYPRLIIPLLKAIQELKAEIDELKNK